MELQTVKSDKMLLLQTLNSVNFQNLTILICHLLMGGEFQTVQILHGSIALNHHLLHDIGNGCLNEISWMAIDLTQSEIPKWNDIMKPNQYIQLIFIDSDVQCEVHQLSKLPPIYYRLFVFHPNGDRTFIPKISNKTKLDSDSNSVSLIYDADRKIKAYLLHDDLTAFHQEINLKDLNKFMTSIQVFDQVFGEREKMRKLGIYYLEWECTISGFENTYLPRYLHSFYKHIFTQLKMDFLQLAERTCGPENTAYLRPVSNPIYDELDWDLEPINSNGSGE